MHTLAAYAYAVWEPSAVAVARASLRADPLGAAVMLGILFLESLLHLLEELLKLLILKYLLHVLGEIIMEILLGLKQPLHNLVRHGSLVGHALEDLNKGLVELIELHLRLYHYGARQMIKPRKALVVQSFLECLHQGHPLIQRDIEPVFP